MNWLNLRTETLHAPNYIGSDPTRRATWLSLMLWCAQQENGGIIAGSRQWPDRRWQQTCGVTAAEVAEPCELFAWAGDDLTLWGYDTDKEAEVQARRELARIHGSLGGRPRKTPKEPTSEPTSVSEENQRRNQHRNQRPKAEGEGEGERERNENEKENDKSDSAATSAEVLADRGGEAQLELVPEAAQQPAQPATPPVLTFPCSGKVAQWHLTDAFLAELRAAYPSIDPLAEAKVALLKVTAGAVTRKTAGGMTRFLCSWMDRATNGRPATGAAQARQGPQPQQSAFVPRPSLGALQIELRTIREEIADILHPGGCSGTVEPKGAKRERYDALVARRNRIQAQIEQAA